MGKRRLDASGEIAKPRRSARFAPQTEVTTPKQTTGKMPATKGTTTKRTTTKPPESSASEQAPKAGKPDEPEPQVPLDRSGVPLVPPSRNYAHPLSWTCPLSLAHSGEWKEKSDHVYENVIADPFVYIEGGEGSITDPSGMAPPAFGKGLYELWQRLAKVDPARAREWRMTTTQLLNQVNPKHTNDWRVAYRTREAQESLARRFASGMLAECKALHVLLREESDPAITSQRHEDLVNIYREAIELSVYLGTVESDFEFHLDVRRCGPYLHCKRRLKKQGRPEQELPDDGPIPVLIFDPLVVGCSKVDRLNVHVNESDREEYRLIHQDELGADLEDELEKAIPRIDEGDTIFGAAVHGVRMVFSKDGPQPCSCGGHFACMGHTPE
ncbi:hypothetical protein BO78DRAFT_437299 [Aspergillus sclerotiicarbonarius CBS 121057]|uniref:Uncharacterized protein n=1 Tax=Aspergillus sclerotiicarbonarius (strain CBS 121057 / IBT 28362) TaxID=1448318 RepID=A0A319F2J1_ASPSB|nr:hypothetical protein BO78DRAFT_437299 [Aspergillus sclerotiicarbonarius CBS 121057]